MGSSVPSWFVPLFSRAISRWHCGDAPAEPCAPSTLGTLAHDRAASQSWSWLCSRFPMSSSHHLSASTADRHGALEGVDRGIRQTTSLARGCLHGEFSITHCRFRDAILGQTIEVVLLPSVSVAFVDSPVAFAAGDMNRLGAHHSGGGLNDDALAAIPAPTPVWPKDKFLDSLSSVMQSE